MKKNDLYTLFSIFFTIVCIAVVICLHHIKGKWMDIDTDLESGEGPEVTGRSIEEEGRLDFLLNDDLDRLVRDKKKELDEIEEQWKRLQINYNLQKLLEEKWNGEDDPRFLYEKYFRVKQGELARIEKVDDLSYCGMLGFLNGHFSGSTFTINDGMLLQYTNSAPGSIWESGLPRAVIITESSKYGFMDARAGMDFGEIQRNAYEAPVQEGFMYFYEAPVYYIQYTDQFYEYTFISDFEDGKDSWLIVDHCYQDF